MDYCFICEDTDNNVITFLNTFTNTTYRYHNNCFLDVLNHPKGYDTNTIKTVVDIYDVKDELERERKIVIAQAQEICKEIKRGARQS